MLTVTLTAGPDNPATTDGNDIINALNIDAAGNAATTFSAFDTIDGRGGNDTLNIYADGTQNNAFPTNATVKNIETVNIYNSGAAAALGDASKYEGVTALNQIGANAANVTNLADTTVAGFNATTQAAIKASAAATATSATVALTNVAEATTLTIDAAAGGALNSVKVSGTRVDATPATPVDDLNLTITAGKNVESLAINTAVNSKLTVDNEGSSTKALSTIDASASTGNIDLQTAALANTVANVKTGAGADKVGLTTSLNATVKTASVSTGAGNDTINVAAVIGAAAAGQAVTVDAGEGNDVINLTIASGAIVYNIQASAGDDTVVIGSGTVKTTDTIDGGEGIDTISMAAKASYVADDYIVFNKVLTNFEILALTGVTAATLDASQLAANYTGLDINAGSSVIKVGAQALVANGGLTATANGTDTTATPAKVYAGTLNLTEKTTGTITANAATVNLTVDASAAAVTGTLEGFAQSATVNLVQALNAGSTAYVGAAAFELTTSGTVQTDLVSLKLSGNGTATVVNADTTKLVTVDASALNSVTFDGKVANGLTYTSENTLAETVILGAGIDTVNINASTYGKMDSVQGLNLVLNAAGNALDASSDVLTSNDIALVAGSKGFTTAHTDLELALKDAAAYAAANSGIDLAFHQGGNTYLFHDAGTLGSIDAADTVIQLVGQINLDALIVAGV